MGGRFIGYARVSTQDQNPDLQINALKAAGVTGDNLYVEKLSATSKKRPELDYAISELREGDTLLVWRLDRFARSNLDLYTRLEQILSKGASFKAIDQSFDIGTTSGKFMMAILGAVAEFERDMIAERTAAGIAAYRAKHGPRWGAPLQMTPDKIARAGELLNGGRSGPEVGQMLGVSHASIYKFWKKSGAGYVPKSESMRA